MKEPKSKRHYSASVKTNEYTSDFSSFLPITFHSPYIDTDYQIFEGIWQNTLVGTAIDVRVEYAIGRGLKPTFYLRDKSIKDAEEKKRKLAEYDEIISELMRIDDMDRINMTVMSADLLRNRHVFGRSVLAFERDNLDSLYALKPIHARDLGRIFVKQDDWSLSSVYAFQKTDLIYAKDMIYSCQFPFSPIRRGYWYGFSSVQRVMGQARAIRAINEFDIPEIAQAMWAGYGNWILNQDGMSASEKQADINTFRAGLKPGAFNVVTGSGNPDDVRYIPAGLEPKVAELGQIKDNIDRDIIGNFQIPGGMFGREADQTRATMLGKIKLFTQGPVESDRREIGRELAKQWYKPNLIAMGHEEILKDVGIEVTFEPIIIESWADTIDAVAKFKQVFPGVPEDELLRMANAEDLIGKIKSSTVLQDKEQMETIKNFTKDSELKNKMQQQIEKKET